MRLDLRKLRRAYIYVDGALALIDLESQLAAAWKQAPTHRHLWHYRDSRTTRLLTWSEAGQSQLRVRFELSDKCLREIGVGFVLGASNVRRRLARLKIQQDDLETHLANLGYRRKTRRQK
jgi:hypothetical protein